MLVVAPATRIMAMLSAFRVVIAFEYVHVRPPDGVPNEARLPETAPDGLERLCSSDGNERQKSENLPFLHRTLPFRQGAYMA